MRLLYLIHASPSVTPEYRAALADDVDVVALVAPGLPGVEGGGMSSRYVAFAPAMRTVGGGDAFLGLTKRYPPPRPLSEYDAVWVAPWSAGYAFLRGLTVKELGRFDGFVLLDSGHTNLDPDGTASDAGVAWAVELAKAAKTGGAPFWIGHSDVKTYGTVASTTKFAAEVLRLAGGPGGQFVVGALDVEREDSPEHVAALKGWGPHFVAAAMAANDVSAPSPSAGSVPTPRVAAWEDAGLPLGVRALAYGLDKLGIREVAGPGSNDFIRECLERCERGGKPLGLWSDETAWCAAFASRCLFEVLVEAETPPHLYRAAVSEIWADARDRGFAREPHWQPAVGDLAICKRNGKDPRAGGEGHVARVVSPPDASGRFRTIDGNHDNSVALVDRVRDATLVGWIAMPAGPTNYLDPERAAELLRIEAANDRGDVGLPKDAA